MTTRRRCLPTGWYPDTAGGVRRAVERFLADDTQAPRHPPAVAGVAPHAGWTYSGAIAALVVRSLDPEAGTVVVVGGHLGGRDRPLAAPEDSYETPLGEVPADRELREELRRVVDLGTDDEPDNTVEVQLPLVRCLYPQARALWLRAPPSTRALDLGAELERVSRRMGRALVVLGSTDLTHYGLSYGYHPHGFGAEAVRWVREVNDARMVASLVDLDPETVLRAAAEDRSACSPGAALAAMGFARACGARAGRLVRYATSLDAVPGGRSADSFVGYAGVIYAPGEERARSTTSSASARAAPSSSAASG